MPTKKYKIILDTNFIWNDQNNGLGVIFSEHLNQLSAFIKKHDLMASVQICLPEMVIKERVAQKVRKADEFRRNSMLALKSLETINLKVGNKKFEIIDLEKAFKKKAADIVSTNNIEVIPIPKIKNHDIINRSLRKIPPFSKKNTDSGYKDTIIWLSILEDAKKSKDFEYIFCTENTNDFIIPECADEFKKITKINIEFVNNLDELKLFLDKELILNLELKKLNERITDEIKQHLGNLNIEFNKFVRKEPDPFPRNPYTSLRAFDSILGEENKGAIKGYNVLNFAPTNIDQKNKYQFSIEGDLMVEEVFDNSKNEPFLVYRPSFGVDTKPITTQWRTHFIWNDQNKTFTSLFTNRPYPPVGMAHSWGMI